MRVLVIGAGAVGGWLAGHAGARRGRGVPCWRAGRRCRRRGDAGLTLLAGRPPRASSSCPSRIAPRICRSPMPSCWPSRPTPSPMPWPGAAPAFAHGPLVVTAMNGLPWWFLDGLEGPLQGQRLESIDPGGKAAAMLGGVRPVGAVVHASMRAEAPGVIRVPAVDRLILGEPGGNVSRETMALGELVDAGGVACPDRARHPPGDLGQAVGQHEHEPRERPHAAHRQRHLRRAAAAGSGARDDDGVRRGGRTARHQASHDRGRAPRRDAPTRRLPHLHAQRRGGRSRRWRWRGCWGWWWSWRRSWASPCRRAVPCMRWRAG